MILHRPAFRAIALALALLGAGLPAAHALVSLEDGLDKIFIEGTLSVGYDSNVFTNSSSGGDTTYSYTLTAELTRQAGWIGVNASASISDQMFGKYTKQDSINPNFNLELTKHTGRTTGSLTLAAARQSRADVAVNTRDTSWNYNLGLNFKYPIIERYSLTGTLGYGYTAYDDRTIFDNLASYTASLNLYYVLSEGRDLFGGYRYRYEQSSAASFDVDHMLSIGVSGKIAGPFVGTLSVGYQVRTDHGLPKTQTFDDLSGSASLTWNLNAKTALTIDASKDYSVTANDLSVDQNNIDAQLTYAYNNRWSGDCGIGGGRSDYLGINGVLNAAIPGSPHRRDEFWDWNVDLHWNWSQHLKIALGYTYYENWSNLALADFRRSMWNATLNSRW